MSINTVMIPQEFFDAVTYRFKRLSEAIERNELTPACVFIIATQIQAEFIEAMSVWRTLQGDHGE